jgi:hypothetical protein
VGCGGKVMEEGVVGGKLTVWELTEGEWCERWKNLGNWCKGQ